MIHERPHKHKRAQVASLTASTPPTSHACSESLAWQLIRLPAIMQGGQSPAPTAG